MSRSLPNSATYQAVALIAAAMVVMLLLVSCAPTIPNLTTGRQLLCYGPTSPIAADDVGLAVFPDPVDLATERENACNPEERVASATPCLKTMDEWWADWRAKGVFYRDYMWRLSPKQQAWVEKGWTRAELRCHDRV